MAIEFSFSEVVNNPGSYDTSMVQEQFIQVITKKRVRGRRMKARRNDSQSSVLVQVHFRKVNVRFEPRGDKVKVDVEGGTPTLLKILLHLGAGLILVASTLVGLMFGPIGTIIGLIVGGLAASALLKELTKLIDDIKTTTMESLRDLQAQLI
jgi:hypothetical protein